jgi:O-antigen/teichoic acid export membrane protein
MSRGRTQRILRGLGFGYLHTGATVLVGLWLTPYLLGRLEPQNYGLWLLAAQVVFYLGLLDLGIVALVPREVAGASGLPEHERLDVLRRLVGQTVRLTLWQLLPVAIVGWAVMWLLPTDWEPLRGPLGIVIVVFVVFFPCRVPVAVLQGMQDLPFVAAVQLVSWIASTAITVAGVASGLGLYALALGWVAAQAISAALAIARLARKFPELLPRRLPSLTRTEMRQQLGRGVWISVGQVAQVLLQGTDLLVIGKLLGPQAVVTYVCTGKLMALLANQPQLFMQLALPALSELRTSASRARLIEVSGNMTQVMLLGSGGIATAVLAVNGPFTGWWVGGDQFGGVGLTAALLAAMLVRHFSVTAVYALYCFGNEQRLAITSIVEGIVGVIAMLILVPLVGLYGAPLGSLLATCLVSLPSNFFALARQHGTSVLALVSPLRSWFARTVVLLGAVAVVTSLWHATGLAAILVSGALATAAYLGMMLPLLRVPPLGPVLDAVLRPWVAKIGALPAPGWRRSSTKRVEVVSGR